MDRKYVYLYECDATRIVFIDVFLDTTVGKPKANDKTLQNLLYSPDTLYQ